MADLTPTERQQLAEWLKKQAQDKNAAKLLDEINGPPDKVPVGPASGKLRKAMEEQGPPPAELKNPEAHHDLPQAFRDRFERADLNIDAPEHGRWVDNGSHQTWSAEFNSEWKNFFDQFDRAGRTPTTEEILAFKNKICKDPRFQK